MILPRNKSPRAWGRSFLPGALLSILSLQPLVGASGAAPTCTTNGTQVSGGSGLDQSNSWTSPSCTASDTMALKGFRFKFTDGDHKLAKILTKAQLSGASVNFIDKNRDNPYQWEVSAAELPPDTLLSTESGTGAGCSTKSISVPSSHVPVLRGFSFEFTSGDHKMDKLKAQVGASQVQTCFGDNSKDDEYQWEVDYAMVPSDAVYTTGQLSGTHSSKSRNLPSFPNEVKSIVIVGFYFDGNAIGSDMNVEELKVLIDNSQVQVEYADKSFGGSEDQFLWTVTWAAIWTPPAIGWDIAFVNMTADFGAQVGNEVVAAYEASKDRAHEVSIFASRCDAADDDREDVTPGVVAVSVTSSDKNVTHDELTLTYDFNKTLVGSSNIWNATNGMIKFCQRLRLVHGNMTIAEDVREFGVNLTLDSEFNFTSGLDPETVEDADGAASLDSFLNPFKCNGGSFEEDTSDLSPNDYLYVCIESIQDGVEIDSLESMIIEQAGITTFQAIDDGAAVFPSLTSTTYAEDDKVWVSTRFPINAFDFEAPGASVSVSGNAVLKFADGYGRRLQGDVVNDPARESEFELEVKLTTAGAGDYSYAMSPAERVLGTVLPALGSVFAAAHSFW